MRYAVTGYGRCGSHWVRDLVRFITGLPLVNDNIDYWQNLDSPAMLHTHDAMDALQRKITQDHFFILCVRRNSFNALISLAVARHTNEWYHYTDTNFDPFYIDPMVFKEDLVFHAYNQHQLIETARRFQTPHSVCEFEDLIVAQNPYQYVAQLIGYRGQISSNTIKKRQNTRDYKKIVRNYDELKEIWRLVENDRKEN